MIGDAGKHVCEPGLGIDAVQRCRLDQRVHNGCAAAALVRAAEGPVIAHMRPQAAYAALVPGEHQHGGIVDVQAFRGMSVLFDRIAERHQTCRRGANPIGHGGDIEFDALAGEESSLCRLRGRCAPYFPDRISASSCGPARPRAIGWDGAGGCAIASQLRVPSSPSLRSRPPQQGQACGDGNPAILSRDLRPPRMLRRRISRRLRIHIKSSPSHPANGDRAPEREGEIIKGSVPYVLPSR